MPTKSVRVPSFFVFILEFHGVYNFNNQSFYDDGGPRSKKKPTQHQPLSRKVSFFLGRCPNLKTANTHKFGIRYEYILNYISIPTNYIPF
jgi:hypothetical protein